MTVNLPLVRLSAINPFLLELCRRGADAESLLRSLGLPLSIPASNEIFVSSTAIYDFVERSAKLVGDRYLGFTIGSTLDLQSWDPIALSAEGAKTVGDLLVGFTVHAAEHSSAPRFYLNTIGDRSTFGFERINEPSLVPGQIDAFYMGLMARTLKHATADQWDSSKVFFRVADPECVPQTFESYIVAKGDGMGIQIKFPSLWMLEKFKKSHFGSAAGRNTREGAPSTLIGAISAVLKPHVHESDLSVDKAASICGYDRRRLASELRKQGTTLSKEIAKLRAQQAEQDLVDTNRSVADIAEAVGFSDATVFSRAFKNWTGQSPQEYRRNNRQ
jgi:AraC-like DNA-binding protein